MQPNQNEVNRFLDVLRASGVTNMYGAGPYVEDHFEVDRRTAGKLLTEWMRTFAARRERGETVE